MKKLILPVRAHGKVQEPVNEVVSRALERRPVTLGEAARWCQQDQP